ncbi:MAG TPA: nitrilase-related carbon-nitrogen hydrolase [Leptospiraceae bacterium]|nr:nitrilase-related carbon-nitrogen hydrolase [Leptospiraceae bacterium]
MKIRLCQIQVDASAPEKNFSKIRQILTSASEDLIVFPEACTTGFPYRRLTSITEANQTFLDEIALQSANRTGVILLPLLIEENNAIYNRQHWITGGKIAATYDKIHLIGILGEDRFLTRGSAIVTVPWKPHIAGLATCYDLRFPELFRKLILKGADILAIPAMWPMERAAHLHPLAKARAIENQAYVLVCNGCGPCGSMNLCGSSIAIDPKGEVIAQAGSEEEQLTFEIDPAFAAEWRKDFPALGDIRLI